MKKRSLTIVLVGIIAILSAYVGIGQEEDLLGEMDYFLDGEEISEAFDVVPKSEEVETPVPTAEFSVNPTRFDPYKNFKFRVKWDGRYVAGVSYVSPLIRTTEVIEHRAGGDPSSTRKSPGMTSYEPIILERGVTHDTDFENWAYKVWGLGHGLGSEVSLKDFRKDIRIEFYNEAGQLALAYNVYRCWVSEYQALPELDANNPGVAFQRIKLEHEGWLRDDEVTEPQEPSL